MKPWRIRIVALVILIIVGASALLLMPGSREVRLKKQEKELSDFVVSRGGRAATATEVAEVKKAKVVKLMSENNGPELTLFVPSIPVNVAVLTRNAGYPNLTGYSVFIAPLDARESQSSSKAVGMCLLSKGWSQASMITAAGNIGGSAKVIDEAWDQISPEEKATIKKAQDANGKIAAGLGDMRILVTWKNHNFLLRDWITADALRPLFQRMRE